MSEVFEKFVTDGTSFKVLPGVRTLPGQKVGVDEFTLVFPAGAFGQETFIDKELLSVVSRADLTRMIDLVLKLAETEILHPIGLDLGSKIFENGVNQYIYAREVGCAAGVLAYGGNAGTLMFRLTGHGSQIACDQWPLLVTSYAKRLKAHLTRVDLAYDDFDGSLFAVRKMAELAETGIFQRGPVPPKFNQAGEWLMNDPRNKGLTFYVGDRKSKLGRIYEKGKEQGDETSHWVRFEVELHSSLYELPLEVLTKPTSYFAALYPCCEWIESAPDLNRLQLKTKTGLNSVDGIGDWLRVQTGHYLQQLRHALGDTVLLDWICRDGKPVKAIQALQLLDPPALAELISGIQAEINSRK